MAALIVATFNLYALWWLGRTWWQLKQEDGDAGKHPFWHVLAMLVPIYSYFRFYDHMRTIGRVAATPEARSALSPLPMTVAWIIINILASVASQTEAPAWALFMALLLTAALIGWAQHGLNLAWQSLPGPHVRARTHPLHWVLFVIGGLLLAVAMLPSVI